MNLDYFFSKQTQNEFAHGKDMGAQKGGSSISLKLKAVKTFTSRASPIIIAEYYA